MSRKQNRKGRNRYRPFVMLRHDMLDSAAYRSLPPPARAVYIEILRRYNGANNGNIGLSCREAAALCCISDGTAGRAFKSLQERGLIKIGHAASFSMKTRTSTRWYLTHEAAEGEVVPSNEWRNWSEI